MSRQPVRDPDDFPRWLRTMIWLGDRWVLLLVVAGSIVLAGLFDRMMTADARAQCANDGGSLTAAQTEAACRQAGVIR